MTAPTDFDPEKKEMETGTSDESTITAQAEENKVETDDSTLEGRNNELPATEYPHGLRLIIVIMAIIFSVFLLALDQVSSRNLLNLPPEGF
jgi:hypothetical protein